MGRPVGRPSRGVARSPNRPSTAASRRAANSTSSPTPGARGARHPTDGSPSCTGRSALRALTYGVSSGRRSGRRWRRTRPGCGATWWPAARGVPEREHAGDHHVLGQAEQRLSSGSSRIATVVRPRRVRRRARRAGCSTRTGRSTRHRPACSGRGRGRSWRGCAGRRASTRSSGTWWSVLGEARRRLHRGTGELRARGRAARLGVTVGDRGERREPRPPSGARYSYQSGQIEVTQARPSSPGRARRSHATPGGCRRWARTGRCRAAGSTTSSGTGSGRKSRTAPVRTKTLDQVHAETVRRPGDGSSRSADSQLGGLPHVRHPDQGRRRHRRDRQRTTPRRRRHPGRPHRRHRRPRARPPRRRSTPPARSSHPGSSTCTRTTTRRCSGTARSRRRRCTASRPRSPGTAASPSRRCRTTRPTATTSCACWRVSRACRSSRCATACRGTGSRPREYFGEIEGTARDQRGVHGRPLRDPPRGDGGGVHRARGEGRGARGDARVAARRARGRRDRVLVVVGAHAQRRGGPHGPVALRVARRDRRPLLDGR